MAEPILPGAHVAVLGAGIVGAACAFDLTRRGYRVTLVDRAPPGEGGPSRGNAAHVAGADILPLSAPDIALTGARMLLRADGPLKIPAGEVLRLVPWLWQFWRAGRGAARERSIAAMAALGAEAVPMLEALVTAAGQPDLVTRCEVLFLYESQAAFDAAADGWARRRAAGVQARAVDAAAIRTLEPDLAPIFVRGMLADRWAVAADPLKLTRALAAGAQTQGAVWVPGAVAAVRPAARGVVLEGPGVLVEADAAVLAGGVWTRLLAHGLGDSIPLEAERGYNITCPAPGVRLAHPIVFDGRGVVSTTLPTGLRIGGWAEFGGLSRPANPRFFRRIRAVAKTLLPGLNDADAVEWMGHRPAMPDSVPVLARSGVSPRVIYACGHGHYGLTWSAVTARIVADLLAGGEAPGYALSRC
jgi:D-amino-acid dehydrogenase